MKISSKIYKNLIFWVKSNLQVFARFPKIKSEDVINIKLERFIEKDGYILALMLITVPLAGELKFYPLNEEFRVSFGAPVFSSFYRCCGMCPLCCRVF